MPAKRSIVNHLATGAVRRLGKTGIDRIRRCRLGGRSPVRPGTLVFSSTTRRSTTGARAKYASILTMSSSGPLTVSQTYRTLSILWHDSRMEERSSSHDHSLDSATVELGRRQIARIRAQLNPVMQSARAATIDDPDVSATSAPVVEESEVMSVDRMTAEMATAAERDRLQARIIQLEVEVRQLRNALATILDAAATGIAASASGTVQATDSGEQQAAANVPRNIGG